MNGNNEDLSEAPEIPQYKRTENNLRLFHRTLDKPTRYKIAIQQASEMAGGNLTPDPSYNSWNQRYLTALQIFGLEINEKAVIADFKDSLEYPENFKGPITAPHAYRASEALELRWKKDSLITWIKPDPDNHKIVAAALQGVDGYILISVRHYDGHTHQAIRSVFNSENFHNRNDAFQGFVDNYGIYRTREEAFDIAKASDQINKIDERCRHLWLGHELYSEMLY